MAEFESQYLLSVPASCSRTLLRRFSDSMPRVRTLKSRNPPEGWELIESTLEDLQSKMRDAEKEPHEGKRKCESLWPILRIHHQRSRCENRLRYTSCRTCMIFCAYRYLFEMHYLRQEISRELYEYCCQEGYADRNLIAKWRKPGFEKLCCLKYVDVFLRKTH